MTVQVFNRAARLPFGAYKMCAEACSAQMILETTSFHQEGFQKPSRRELLPVTTMDDTDNVNNCNNSESDQSDSHSPRSPNLCYGCKKPLDDSYRLRVSPDMEWHPSCLVCTECKVNLDEYCTCFMRDGRPYCRNDFMRLFSHTKCSSCQQPIGSDYAMRAKDMVYHMRCFVCSSCEKELVPGEQFGFCDGKLFCKSDFDLFQQDGLDSPSDSSDHLSVENYGSNSNSTNTSSSSSSFTSSSVGGSTTRAVSTKRSNSDKGPRVRTVLTEQQLQTLRTVYSNNPRPDALMKEHLVEITALSPKVIRVWFQNKRCKDKKKLKHDDAMQQRMGAGGNCVLPPLTPQTPLTPDSLGQMSPHPGMSAAFTYPSTAPSSYESLPPTTPTQTAVSPILTYQQQGHVAWSSPTTSIPHFDHSAGDFTTPSITSAEHNGFVHSTAIVSHPGGYY